MEAATELCFDSQEALLASSAVRRLIESEWLCLTDLEPWSATAAREHTAEAVRAPCTPGALMLSLHCSSASAR